MNVEKNKTASFEVDPQIGFTELAPNELPVPGGTEIVGALNAQALLAQYRIVSKDCHPAVAPWITENPEEIMTPVEGAYKDLDVKWPAHCVVGTEGNNLIPGLPVESEYDLVVEKGDLPEQHPYGACYKDLADTESTGAIEWLKGRGVEAVIVGGLATNFCVFKTVTQLLDAGFKVILNVSACRGIEIPEDSDAVKTIETSIKIMADMGATIINSAVELNAA